MTFLVAGSLMCQCRHVDRVEIVFQGETIAVHMRCYGVAQPNGPLRNAKARGGIKNPPLLELASYARVTLMKSHLPRAPRTVREPLELTRLPMFRPLP